jgi:hypothetical protein
MPRSGPRAVWRYSDEFKLTAVRLSQQPGIQVKTVAAAAGERSEAAAIVRRVPPTFGERVAPVHLAWAHHALGQRDDAVGWLEHGYQRSDLWINNLAVDPLLDGIHSDPRVRRLLVRLRLDHVSPGR